MVYSLASPVRKLPTTGEVKRSALKPIGAPYTSTAIDTNKDAIVQATIEPATEQEIEDTVTVMGGQDWELWIDALDQAGVLADGARTVAFSYIGTDITWPIYWHGALGRAKVDLDQTAQRLDARLRKTGGTANVAVLKSVVTQASSAIPVMPLYISIVFKVMKELGLHEGTIEQLDRLFRDRMYRTDGAPAATDDENRLRLDDWELKPEVQTQAKALWPQVTSENLFQQKGKGTRICIARSFMRGSFQFGEHVRRLVALMPCPDTIVSEGACRIPNRGQLLWKRGGSGKRALQRCKDRAQGVPPARQCCTASLDRRYALHHQINTLLRAAGDENLIAAATNA